MHVSVFSGAKLQITNQIAKSCNKLFPRIAIHLLKFRLSVTCCQQTGGRFFYDNRDNNDNGMNGRNGSSHLVTYNRDNKITVVNLIFLQAQGNFSSTVCVLF